MVMRMSPLRSGWAATAPGIAALTFWSTSAGVYPLYPLLSPWEGRIVIALLLLGRDIVLPKLAVGGTAATAAQVGLDVVGRPRIETKGRLFVNKASKEALSS
jgi:hypothetical protein